MKREAAFLALILFLGCFMPFPAVGATLEVCLSGCAYDTIQGAIDDAVVGDILLVGEGTYRENIDFLGKGIAITSVAGPGLTVIDGGSPADPLRGSVVTFASGEPSSAILSGFTVTGGSGTFRTVRYYIDPANSYPQRVGGGIYIAYSSNPVIENCEISGNGIVDEETGESTSRFGAGVYVEGSAPLIRASTIRDNSIVTYQDPPSGPGGTRMGIEGRLVPTGSGGGVSLHAATLTMEDCTVEGNSSFAGAGIHGGAGEYAELPVFDLRHLEGLSSSAAVTGTSVVNNRVSSSGRYGGIYMEESSLIISGSDVSGNSGSDIAHGITMGGSLEMDSCTVGGNQGTGITVDEFNVLMRVGSSSIINNGDGGIAVLAGADFEISDSVISGNRGLGLGGGLHFWGELTARVSRCFISGNTALYGGGVYAGYGADPVLVNSVISGNRADYGGGIAAGRAIDSPTLPRIVNCTVSGNRAEASGGGIWVHDAPAHPTVVNTIVWGNEAGIEGDDIGLFQPSALPVEPGGITVGYSIVGQEDPDSPGSPWPGEGNSLADPALLAATPAVLAPTVEGDYRLTPCSAAIDSGTDDPAAWPDLPAGDIEGMPRPFGPGVDMGAYETDFPAVAAAPPVANSDDVSVAEDGEVTIDTGANDYSPGGGTLGLTFLGEPRHGTVGVNPQEMVTYVPPGDFNGEDLFWYAVSDGVCTASAAVSVNILPVEDEALEVCPAGCPYDSIQSAIDAAWHGDTVLVHRGTYLENIDFGGKAVAVRSVEGPAVTVIDGGSPSGSTFGSTVTFDSFEGPGSVLDGFTITGGFGQGDTYGLLKGGGVLIQGHAYQPPLEPLYTSPTIENCVIRGNVAAYGGGVYVSMGRPLVNNCVVSGNYALREGGGIAMSGGGGGVIHTTITGNASSSFGPGIKFSGNSLVMANSIVRDNGVWHSEQVAGSEYSTTDIPGLTVLYSNVHLGYSQCQEVGGTGACTWPGEGNINEDTSFLDPRPYGDAPTAEGNYHLLPTAPSVDAGTAVIPGYTALPAVDIDGHARPQGAAPDMGADEHVFRGDWNADGSPDLFWRNSTSGVNYLWYMDDRVPTGGAPVPALTDVAWSVGSTADFNGDGSPDILWRNSSTGANYLWYMDGPSLMEAEPFPAVGAQWTVAGTADFNVDGNPDILWRNPSSGANYLWYMDGPAPAEGGPLPGAGPDWTVGATADFNDDGKPDILWRKVAGGQNHIWFFDGVTVTGSSGIPPAHPDWTVAGAADFDGDGKPDICWRNYTTGDNYLWYMDGPAITGAAPLPKTADTDWRLEQ